MTSISVTQALAEIKLLRDRIDSALSDSEFMMVKTKKSLVDADKFGTQARASYQSFNDLVARYNKLKSAIVISNATTRVTIAGKEYTVAEAVERKRSIKFEEKLLQKMKEQYYQTNKEYNAHLEAQQARVDRLLSQELGKDSKTSVEVVKALSETFLAENKAELLDPLKLGDKIKLLTEEIRSFETTVDYTLSESNGRTTIIV
jgi:hypothetical protein